MDINVTGDALPWLRQMQAELKDGSTGLRKVMAAQGAKTVRGHLRDLDRKRHRPHMDHHFYASAARATSWQVQGDTMQVSIDHVGIAQRFYGGTIRPRRSKYLAIPANNEAQRHSPREVGGLHFQPTRKGGLLANEDNRVMYWLVKEVTQQADPSVLPDEADLNEAVIEAGKDYLERI